MKNIRRIIGRRKNLNAPEVNIKTVLQSRNKKKKKKSGGSKRKRWDAILSRLPNNIPLLGAEIGVLNGNTAFRILEKRPLLTHYMIDPWIAPKKDSSYWKSADDNARKPAQAHEGAYKKTLDRVRFAGKRAIIMRMFSHQAVKKIKDKSLDFVFIDGDHSYDGVSKDIKMWLPKVKKDGWIGGHDLNHPRLPGVSKAVYEAFDENIVEKDDNRTWFVRL